MQYITINNYTTKELDALLFDRDLWEFKIKTQNNGCGVYYFENFHYFSPEHLIKENDFYIIAHDSNNLTNILGVLKYGWYGGNIAVTYIDIHRQYKRKGIATQLIARFNDILTQYNTKYLELSRLSNEGKQANIDLVFKRLINAVPILTSY